jgi:hypothetical protein
MSDSNPIPVNSAQLLFRNYYIAAISLLIPLFVCLFFSLQYPNVFGPLTKFLTLFICGIAGYGIYRDVKVYHFFRICPSTKKIYSRFNDKRIKFSRKDEGDCDIWEERRDEPKGFPCFPCGVNERNIAYTRSTRIDIPDKSFQKFIEDMERKIFIDPNHNKLLSDKIKVCRIKTEFDEEYDHGLVPLNDGLQRESVGDRNSAYVTLCFMQKHSKPIFGSWLRIPYIEIAYGTFIWNNGIWTGDIRTHTYCLSNWADPSQIRKAGKPTNIDENLFEVLRELQMHHNGGRPIVPIEKVTKTVIHG